MAPAPTAPVAYTLGTYLKPKSFDPKREVCPLSLFSTGPP